MNMIKHDPAILSLLKEGLNKKEEIMNEEHYYFDEYVKTKDKAADLTKSILKFFDDLGNMSKQVEINNMTLSELVQSLKYSFYKNGYSFEEEEIEQMLTHLFQIMNLIHNSKV